MDEVAAKTSIYTDVGGLKELQYTKNKQFAKKEVAKQFESLMMQMVFKSMRDASGAFSSGLFDNKTMGFYEDMLDKQVSLMLSNSNIGFAKMVENNIDMMTNSPVTPPQPPANEKNTATAVTNAEVKTKKQPMQIEQAITQKNIRPGAKKYFSSAEDFIKKLWSVAKEAADLIGTKPEILLAQAALETNWGKNILSYGLTQSSHNLYNIKADNHWNNKVTTVKTIEQQDGVLVKEQANFRSYDSYRESMMDYVHFLKNHSRYNHALQKAANPEAFIRAIHEAGYATDPQYSEKIIKILSSQHFQKIVQQVKSI